MNEGLDSQLFRFCQLGFETALGLSDKFGQCVTSGGRHRLERASNTIEMGANEDVIQLFGHEFDQPIVTGIKLACVEMPNCFQIIDQCRQRRRC